MFRINYGNGSVSRTFRSKAEAARELAVVDCNANCWIQRYMGDGEWARV